LKVGDLVITQRNSHGGKNMSEKEEVTVKQAQGMADEGVEGLAHVVRAVVEPLARSQEGVAKEATKQTEILARSYSKVFIGILILAGLVILLAGVALFLGKEQVTEKVLIALVGFLGGLGFGRTVRR
jgi:hypothetical protein